LRLAGQNDYFVVWLFVCLRVTILKVSVMTNSFFRTKSRNLQAQAEGQRRKGGAKFFFAAPRDFVPHLRDEGSSSLCRISVLKKIRNGGILLLALSVWGCASGGKTGKRTEKEAGARPAKRPAVAAPAVDYDESFDPGDVKEIPFTVPHKSQAPMVQSQTGLPVQADTTARDTTWVTVPGYQLQLLQTENGAEARETLRFAILDLNTDAEIVYDAPYYKVRAGHFLNRAEAERLQALADGKGYTNSWVVRTSIKIRAYELSE
jgi:hypothetical protein